MTRIIILFLLLMLIAPISGQVIPSYHFTEDDGLPDNMVKDVIIDHEGLVWIATDSGISIYDGNSFRTLSEKHGLPSNRVRCLTVDDENNIYAGCFKSGLCLIQDYEVKEVYTYGNVIYPNSYRELHYSSHLDMVFTGTDNGLYALTDDSLFRIKYDTIVNELSNILSISSEDSILYWTVLRGDYGMHRAVVDPLDLSKINPERISLNRFASYVFQGLIYVSEYDTILKYDVKKTSSPTETYFVDSSQVVWTIAPYKKNQFLVGCIGDDRLRADIGILSNGHAPITKISVDENNSTVNGIIYDSIRDVSWFARDNGLTAYWETPFTSFQPPNFDKIKDIEFFKGNLYVLTETAIFQLQDESLKKVVSTKDIEMKINDHFKTWENEFGLDFIYLFDTPRTSSLSYFTKTEDHLLITTGLGSISLLNNTEYFPYCTGAFSITTDNQAYSTRRYYPLRLFKNTTSMDWYYLEDSLGYVEEAYEIVQNKGWVFSRNIESGLCGIKNDKIHRLNESNSVIDNHLTDIVIDENGTTWCSSVKGNIFELNIQDSLYIERKITGKEMGLIGSRIKWISFTSNNLLIGTEKGLNIVSVKHLQSSSPSIDYYYNKFNGFEQVSSVSPVKGENGETFVHTGDLLVKISDQHHIEPPEDIRIFNISIDGKETKATQVDQSVIPYSTQQISFEFNCLKYPFDDNIVYNYRINGTELKEGNKLYLNSLRSGKYEIQLTAFDIETATKRSKKIVFSVAIPVWRTWWFICSSLLLVGLIVFLFVRFRINSVRRAEEEKTKIKIENAELRLRSLQIQMNPHFIFNALQSIQSFIIEKNPEEAMLYIGILSKVIRSNLENASIEYIPIQNEIEFLLKYGEIESLRFGDNLKFRFENRLKDQNITIPPMLIQPIVENSIKHGLRYKSNEGLIQVVFEQKIDFIKVIIQDDGVGREVADKKKTRSHKGLSMNIIKQRLELLNSLYKTDVNYIEVIDLYEGNEPSGTKVILTLQITRS